MKTVAIDEVKLHYEHTPRAGAPALLLLNSLGTTLEMWNDQHAALQERYELVRFDMRGHGRSALGGEYETSIDRLARDALAVLDACGIARAHICGLSLGGMVAMHLASHWPDRVLKLALCNTSAHMPPREAWQTRIDLVRSAGMEALVEPVIERWFTQPFRFDRPDKVEQIRQMLRATDPAGYAACAAAVRDMDQRQSIRQIGSRTLVIGGTQDPATPPEHAQLLAKSIPAASLVMLEAAHLSNIECADQFTAALVTFLAA